MHNIKLFYRGSLSGQGCFLCRRYASTKTHYDVLGVKKTASQKEIKSAYIELSKKHHPDTAGSKSKKTFTEINEAYSVLSKPLSRREYDNKIAFESAQGTSGTNTFHGQYRPPGSGRPGYPPPPGYQQRNQRNDHYYNPYGKEYSPYTESERRRRKTKEKQESEVDFEEYIKSGGTQDSTMHIFRNLLNYTYGALAITLISFYVMRKHQLAENKAKKKTDDDV